MLEAVSIFFFYFFCGGGVVQKIDILSLLITTVPCEKEKRWERKQDLGPTHRLLIMHMVFFGPKFLRDQM